MSCDEIKPLLEAYALGALDEPDQGMVETHLAECAACRHRLQEYTELVQVLPQAVAAASPLQPPSALKERVLQSVTASQSSASSQILEPSPLTPPPRPKAVTPPKLSWWRPRTWAAVATAILLVALTIWSVQLSVALARERALRAEFANLVDQQEVVLEVIDSTKTTRRVLLPPDQEASNAYGKLFTRADLPHVVAMAARLLQPPPGQAYHLWVTSGEMTHLAGLMKINEQGFALLVFDADRDGPEYDSAWLTLQPEGSQTPVESPVLIWQSGQE